MCEGGRLEEADTGECRELMRAIPRPSSPTRPCNSASSSLISLNSWDGMGAVDGCSSTLLGVFVLFSCPSSLSLSLSFSFSTSQRSTSFIRSSNARTWPTVHFSNFSNRFAMVSRVPWTSRVPWGVNCVYKGGVSFDGDEVPSLMLRIGEGVKRGARVLDGVGETGELGAGRLGGPGGTPKFNNAGSLNLACGLAGQSLLSFSFPFGFFSFSFSLALASRMTC